MDDDGVNTPGGVVPSAERSEGLNAPSVGSPTPEEWRDICWLLRWGMDAVMQFTPEVLRAQHIYNDWCNCRD